MNKESGWNLFQQVVGLENCTRVLLHGPPGTSKTTNAIRSAKDGHYNVTLSEDSCVAELIGHWVTKDGNLVWHNGPAIRAWLEGKPLIINEIDEAAGSVKTVLYAILDDPSIAHLTLPNGQTVSPKEGFRCIATMNGTPADLPEALSDRFDARLLIKAPIQDAINALPSDLHTVCQDAYSSSVVTLTYRQLKSFAALRTELPKEDAATIAFGEKAQEVLTLIKIGRRKY